MTTATRRTALALGAAALARPTAAQTSSPPAGWPDRPVRFIIPFPPGGAADLVGRMLANHLAAAFGRPFVVENRGGAGSSIGVDALAKAPPDGHAIGMGNIAANAILPALQRGRVPYDPVRDFAPVSNLVVTPCWIVVNPAKLDVASVAALVDAARARPDALNYGSSGVGTSLHLGMELLLQKAGVRMTHIPFAGGGPALQALAAGTVDLMVDTLATSAALVRDGRLRALAVTTPRRDPNHPDLPALSETHPGTDLAPWHGLLAPARTPPAVVEVLAAETRRFLALPATLERFAAASLDAAPSHPAEFAAFMETEATRFRTVIESAGILPA